MAPRKTPASRRKATPAAARTIELSEVLDLNSLKPLAAEITEARGQDLVLDASRTVRVSAQAFQLMIAARRSWDRDGHSLSIQGAFEPFHDSMALLGISEADLLGHNNKTGDVL